MTTKVIWKYPLLVLDEQAVNMPMGAKIMCAQIQNGKLCLWALVEPLKPKEERMVVIYGTGHTVRDIPNCEREYIGTVQMEDGSLVWHVFERT